MRARRLTIAIALVIGAINFGWALDAHAALSHYVPFDVGYLAGTDLHGSGGSDLGFGANTWFDGAPTGTGSTVVAGNIPAPAGLPVAGNHASTAPLDFNLAYYTFDLDNDGLNGEPEDALQTGTHWLSFVGSGDLGADFAGLSFKRFFGPEILYIGKTGGAFGIDWGMDAQDGNGGIGAGGDSTVETFLTVKLTLGPNANDDTAELYINPPIAATPPAVADLTLSFNEDPNDPIDRRVIDEIRLGSQQGPFLVDEIRIGGSFADVVGMSVPLGCDFDNSGACDINDIDDLVAEVVAGTNDLTYDLTGDGAVTRADINDPSNGWLRLAGEENIGPGRSYLEGDVTLDGIVDGLDFIEWNNNKFTTTGLWSLADVTADGTTDGLDFIVWNDNKFMSSDGSAVPEPTGLLMMLAGLLTFGVSRRR